MLCLSSFARLLSFLLFPAFLIASLLCGGYGIEKNRYAKATDSSTLPPTPSATPSPTPSAIPSPTPSTIPLPQPTPVGQSGDWKLLFSDDFEGTSIDTNKWTTCYWWDTDGCTNRGNNELEWYQPDEVLVNDGTLKLRAQGRTITASDGKIYNYTSGMITTGRNTPDTSAPTKFVFQFGYIEIRAKIPNGKGLWPGFWTLPDDHSSKPEIDVMEILGHDPHTIHMNLHYLNSDGSDGSNGHIWIGPDFSADWHTFAVDRQPNSIIWYVDGIERWRYMDAAHLPAKHMYLLANLAVGGDWPGAPDSSTSFPSYYEIDYVRVWSR